MGQMAFSIDVEEWFHGIELSQEAWADKPSRIEQGMDILLRILDDSGRHGTFFVLGAVAESHPHLVRSLSDAGHEVASHGYRHEKVYTQTPDVFRKEESRTKCLLEDLTGQPVRGYRAPYFSITHDSAWALSNLRDLGYEYDCSISPVMSWRYGIKGAPEGLFRFSDLDLYEYTVSSWKLLGRRFASGGAYFRIFPFAWTTKPFASSDPTMFYAHPWEYDPDHPRIRFDLRAMVTHYAKLSSMEPKSRRLIETYPFERVCDVIDGAVARSSIPEIDSATLRAHA